MAVTTKIDLRITATEVESNAGAENRPQAYQHTLEELVTYATGTGASQADLVYSVRGSAAASADTYDLAGSLASVVTGSTITFANISGFVIRNNSTTSTENLTIGAGSNPWITWLNATGDAVVIGPGWILMWTSPVDAAAVTATTGDILTIDPGSDTISYDLIIWGQSA